MLAQDRIASNHTFRGCHCEPPFGGVAIQGGRPPVRAMDCRASLAMTPAPPRQLAMIELSQLEAITL
jgi:hypothetical protein